MLNVEGESTGRKSIIEVATCYFISRRNIENGKKKITKYSVCDYIYCRGCCLGKQIANKIWNVNEIVPTKMFRAKT